MRRTSALRALGTMGALCLALAAAALSPAAGARPPRPDLELRLEDRLIPLQDACFPSGLRVLLQEDHAHPIVSVTTVVDGGYADDPEGKAGAAHLLEHLWFRSTQGEHVVGAQLEAMGARYRFADWKGMHQGVARPTERAVDLGTPEPARITRERQAQGVARVALTCPLPEGGLAAEVLASRVEDRTRSALRERRGVSYVAWAWIEPVGETAVLFARVPVQPDAAEEALAVLEEVVAEAAREPGDLRRDKLAVAGDLGQAWLGRDQVARELERRVAAGEDLGDLEGLPDRLAEVDGAEVGDLAAHCAAHAITSALVPQE